MDLLIDNEVWLSIANLLEQKPAPEKAGSFEKLAETLRGACV